MRANRGRDTSPEIAVRKILHGAGFRYRVDYAPLRKLRRRADIVFTRERIAVFIDGCFWHGCPQHYQAPVANGEFWAQKVAANRQRDIDTTNHLGDAGWTVLRFWEHEPAEEVASVVATRVTSQRSARGAGPPRALRRLPEVCVVYLVRTDPDGTSAVLLGRKKTGLGLGKLVGLGGKLEPGETPAHAAAREALEEAGVVIEPSALRIAGVIDYLFPAKPAWSQRSHVFVSTTWQGDPVETDELAPAWFRRELIPFESMWDDAKLWLPGVLAGGSIAATYTFGDDLDTVVDDTVVDDTVVAQSLTD